MSAAPTDGIPAATATVPSENTLLQGTGADVFVVKSGVLRRFVSMQQLSDMGYGRANIIRVPQSPLDALPHGGDLP